MAGRRERFCECGAPPGVPHYCQATANINNNRVGNRPMGPGQYNNWAPNNGYYRQQSWPVVVRPQPPLMAAPPPAGGNKRAVLCGITYGNGPHALKGSVNDVLLMKRFLIDQLGFRPDSILLLRGITS